MFDENAMLVGGGTNAFVSKTFDSFEKERWTPKEKKTSYPLPEPEPMKKKESAARKREAERIAKIHLKKKGSGFIKESKSKMDKSKEDDSDAEKVKNSKTSKFKKSKDAERAEDKVAPESKVKATKSKALSAFGTTFYKTEIDSPPMPKKRPSSSTEPFLRSRWGRSKDGGEDEDGGNTSETKLKKNSSLKDDGEDGRGKGKYKGGKSRSTQRISSDTSMQDGKTGDGKKSSKGKVITAFGSTFRKTENESIGLPKKKTPSFTDRLLRSRSTKLKEGGSELDEDTPSGLCVKQSGTKASISKNKLMDMVEESNRERGKGRGAYSTSTGKRAKSPYQTSSDVKANPSKVRVEGDTAGVKQQSDEKAEIGKELSFFEKLQQNVRAYFSPRAQEMSKIEEEKKRVHDGENDANDESLLIPREDEIMNETKTFVTIAEGEGMKPVFENDSGFLENGDFPKGKRNGSGPGGNRNCFRGNLVDRTNYRSQKISKKVYYIKRGFECTEKRRTASFHRSKTLQKSALAEPSSKSSTSIDPNLEPGEQVQNIPSAYGVASAFAQVQEFHQEITRRNWIKATPVLVQEEYLTPIVNCLPGESFREWTRRESGVCRPRSRPKREQCSNRPFAISRCGKLRASRSEGSIHERKAPVHDVTDELQQGDIPQREKRGNDVPKTLKPDKVRFVPRRTHWFVYSLTETKIGENKAIQTPPLQESTTTANMTPESNPSTGTADEGIFGEPDRENHEKALGKSSIQKKEVTPSFTLKDIISLTRRVFQESKNDSGVSDKEEVDRGKAAAKSRDPSLGYYLEKLMEEKRNYLNFQKTKNFRKAQKANFIADSFNFFNLLNKEFLSVRTSDPSIEKLRNVIAENKDSKMEEYLRLYKKVIRTSLTEPEQYLMNKAKLELERYTDMYYDLMMYICMEKESKRAGKGKVICSNPLQSEKSENGAGINYYEILKQDVGRKANRGSGCPDKVKPRVERSFYMTKIEENRMDREFNTGRNSYRTHNPRKGNTNFDSREQKLGKVVGGTDKMKQIVELLSPQKNKETTLEKDTMEGKNGSNKENSQGKMRLTISVCEDALIIKQHAESPKDEADTSIESNTTYSTALLESSEEEKKNKSNEPLPAEDKHSCSRNSVSEANLAGSVGTSSDDADKTQSELMLKTESDVTVYQKSSIDEENESSESAVEHPILKFRAFRKLLNEGLKYLTSFGESPEPNGHDCPKIPKGARVPETHDEPIKYPKTRICVKKPEEKRARNFFDERKPGHQKSTYVRDPRQTLLRGKGSPVRSRANEMQEEKARRLLKRNLPSFSRGVSPSKIIKRDLPREEDSKVKKETNLWWRSERTSVNNASPVRQSKSHKPSARKGEGNTLTNRISLLSKRLKEAEPPTPRLPRKGGRKNDGRKQKEMENKGKDGELEMQESRSGYATPIGSCLEWQFGMESFKDMLGVPTNVSNPGRVTEGTLICEEAEEKELHKMDLTCGDEKNEGSTLQTLPNESSARELGLRLRSKNPLRMEWDELLEASFRRDYQKVSDVLNQFTGNISEAWKAAIYLKDLIKPKSVEEPTKKESDQAVTNFPQGEHGQESNCKNNIIQSFRNFLRILTNVFEDNQEETSVRRELFLVMKEILQLSSAKSPAKAVLHELQNIGNRTIFHKEIAEIPEEVRDMVAEALVSEDRVFSRTKEDYEPGSFVMAVKDVGEKLKNLYFADEWEPRKIEKEPEKNVSMEKEEVVQKPKKIYYRPPKKNLSDKNGHESTIIKSNLRSLAEKINQIYRERKTDEEQKGVPQEERSMLKNLGPSQTSIYFDATDMFQQSEDRQKMGFHGLSDAKPGRVSLNTVDESYFALSGKTFGKYRDIIYDKIITFLKSDNPYNNNYGMTLLGKMIEKDEGRASGGGPITVEKREEKWYDIVDKLKEMCHFIESEVKEQAEKRCDENQQEVTGEKEMELVRTCEYMKSHVDKMKTLMKEVKVGQRVRDSTSRVQALEESRQSNIERQLITQPDLTGSSFLNQKYLGNAIAFLNSVGMIGCSIDKFSKNFLPSWLAGSKDEEPEPTSTCDSVTVNEELGQDARDSVLECNKAVVMNLKKNIDKRQKKIKEMIDQAAKNGLNRDESLSDERLLRKARDLKKCYNLLEKMICDPTATPPKWLKLADDAGDIDGELFEKKKITPETDFQVMMTVLSDNVSEGSNETRLVRYSRSKATVEPIQTLLHKMSLALVNANFANVNLQFDLPVKGHGQLGQDLVFKRPKTA